MRKLVLSVVALLALPSVCYAAFAIFQTYVGPPQITCDITTGVASVDSPCVSPAATCNGSADDAAAFMAFNTWARANQGSSFQVVLTIPAGKTCFWNSSQPSPTGLGFTVANAWAGGINNLIVEGNGSTLTSVGGVGFTLGGTGICHKGIAEVAGCSARIQSASAGATSVTLTAASLSAGYISRFSIGKWIMVGGLDIQGLWNSPFGYPPNLYYFEWRQVSNVDAGTGIITLDRALSNSYLSTWPLYNSGNSFEADAGGPATIYTVGDAWNVTLEYRNLTISQVGQVYTNGRNVTFRSMIVGSGDGPIPSQNETWSAYTVDYAGLTMEVDKLIGTMTIDGITISQLKFQSSSVDQFTGRNLTVTNSLTGGAKRSDISDSTLAGWSLGAYAYGASTTTTCTRCTVTSFSTEGGISQGGISSGVYSMTSGVISFPNTAANGTDLGQRVFAPMPNNLFWQVGSGGSGDTIGLVRPQSITQDPTDVFVQTNQAGTFPTWSATTLTGFRTHPSPQFTCDTCNFSSGDQTLYAMSVQRGATPLAPYGSYASLDYAPTSAQGALTPLYVNGAIVSATINVTQAYSGSGAATLNLTGQFNNLSTAKQSDWSSFTWGPQINLKQAGSRVITPSGVTCDGISAPTGCSGDSLGAALPEAVWIRGGIAPYMGSTLDVGNQPQFTITIQTDQGVVP